MVPYSLDKLFGGTISSVVEAQPQWHHLPYVPKFTIKETCVPENSTRADREPPLHLLIAHVERLEPTKEETAPAPYREENEPSMQPVPAPEKKPLMEIGEEQKPAAEHSLLSSVNEKIRSAQKFLLAFPPVLLAQQLNMTDPVSTGQCGAGGAAHPSETENSRSTQEVLLAFLHGLLAQQMTLLDAVGTETVGLVGHAVLPSPLLSVPPLPDDMELGQMKVPYCA
ncbi:uncharacterized protein LOC111812130 [Octodon degus]|uniref:Uncharacterized protein LOC111812130 n=1 Tax=Octodon degus TaxID=10160 RepID=A0A6P6D5I3_OCTDE|nr:uncharacterized protein LOC111812130 [Octodon degus]